MNNRSHSGQALKTARTARGWSQTAMSIKMHEKCSRTVSANSLGRYERGEVLPTYQMALALCRCLDVKFDAVFANGRGVA